MSAEELELVTDFASLRAGDLVAVKDCTLCGATHRSLLVRPGVSLAGVPLRKVPGWLMLPSPGCGPAGEEYVSTLTVDERRAFRVVIPPTAETREVARPKKLERTR